MWTNTTRALHACKGLALPSDLSDDEWAVLGPFLLPALPGGRPRKSDSTVMRLRDEGIKAFAAPCDITNSSAVAAMAQVVLVKEDCRGRRQQCRQGIGTYIRARR